MVRRMQHAANDLTMPMTPQTPGWYKPFMTLTPRDPVHTTAAPDYPASETPQRAVGKAGRPSRFRRSLAAWLGVVALLYGAVLGGLWWAQEALLFHPAPLAANFVFDAGSDVHEQWVEVPGARLHALHLQLPHPQGMVFFLHGNAGNLQTWFVNVDFYRRANFDIVMLDYRGFGKSSGTIQSEAQLHADVLQAWNQFAPQYAGKRRVIVGRSLGTGLAASLAAQVQAEQTVLVSPYESMQALAREHYPWVPSAVLRYPLRTDVVLPRIKGPVLLAHGDLDTLIPLSHSQNLQRAMPAARLVVVPGAGHNDLQKFEVYLAAVRSAMVGPGAGPVVVPATASGAGG